MNNKRKGDTLILVGAILSVFLILLFALLAIVLYKLADKTDIAEKIIKGDLEIIDNNFNDSVDYYYTIYRLYFIAMIVAIVFTIIKMVFQILSITKHTKGFYLATAIIAFFSNGIGAIFTIIGCILSLTDINKNNMNSNTTEVPFNYARIDDTNTNNESNVENDSNSNNEN
ncbi:MAG: SUR7/PalI family protein [Acholeplasmatales bacterium]|nr:SUR7/PalI family protein [Acholeplasmatales bacterium]